MEEPRYHEECYACPVGGLFLTARTASPDAFEHLLNAAAELTAVAKAVVEAAERVIDHQREAHHGYQAHPGQGEPGGGPGPEERIQRIRIAGE